MTDELIRLGATKQEFERMQAELKSKSEALRQAEAQEQATEQRARELQRQLEATQKLQNYSYSTVLMSTLRTITARQL